LLPQETRVPADWSAAAFWFEVAALAPDPDLFFDGLSASTELQGDKDAVGLFIFNTHCTQIDDDMILRGRICDNPNPYSANLLETPDLFQPLIFALAGTGKEAEITGLHNLPLKETDRLKAVTEALKTLGCSAEYEGGTFNLRGGITNLSPPPFDPQGDHRMAMALAPLALVCDAVTILHPEVVNKSYPGFWEEMKKVGFLVEFSSED
jgi:3-phosphoshikimate 1-carboxyvinyltransferase